MKSSRLKLFVICVLALSLSILFSSCTFGTDSSDNDIVLKVYGVDGQSTDYGYFMTGYDGGMLFYDYETKQTVPLCNKPDCTHEDENTCAAYVKVGDFFLDSNFVVYGDYIYYFAPESYEKMNIIRTDLDNSNRVTIASDDISYVSTVAAVNNKIYYLAGLHVFDESGERIEYSIQTIRCFDLATNEVSVLVNPESNPKRTVFIQGISSEYLYYYDFLYSDNLETKVIDGKEHELQESLELNLKKCSLSTLEKTLITDVRDFSFGEFNVNRGYYVVKKGEKEYDVCEFNYSSGKLEKLFTSDKDIQNIIGDENRVLCASDWISKDYILFDKRTKTTSEVHFNDENFLSFSPCVEHGDSFIGTLGFKDGQCRAIVNKDAFFEGRLEYDVILKNRDFTPTIVGDDNAEDDGDTPEPYDSNKLVWMTQYYTFDNIDAPRTAVISEGDVAYNDYREFLELLKQNGVDKEIELRRLLIPDGEDRACALEEVINSGAQIDIIEFDYKPLSGLMDLTDYFNTDKGKAIEATFSENVRRGLGETDGKRYFVPIKRTLQGSQNGYLLNDEIMKKNGLTESDLTKDFAELTAVFEKVKSGAYSCYSLGVEPESSIVYPRFLPVGSNSIPFLTIDADKPGAMIENIYENAECIEKLKIVSGWNKNKMSFKSENGELILDTAYTGNHNLDFKVTPVGEAYAENDLRGRALSISKTCQNADAAFDVIALTVTNNEISLALNPYQANIVAPESELKMYDSFGFYADFTPVQKEYDECIKIINARFANKSGGEKFGNPWHGEMADVEAGLKELNAELKAAGIDKILVEFNKQLTEFYNRTKS